IAKTMNNLGVKVSATPTPNGKYIFRTLGLTDGTFDLEKVRTFFDEEFTKTKEIEADIYLRHLLVALKPGNKENSIFYGKQAGQSKVDGKDAFTGVDDVALIEFAVGYGLIEKVHKSEEITYGKGEKAIVSVTTGVRYQERPNAIRISI